MIVPRSICETASRAVLPGLVGLGLLGSAAPAAGQPAAPVAGGGSVAAAALEGCRTDLTLLNQISGWPVRWPGEWGTIAVGTVEERAAAIERWRRAPGALEADVRGLREGIERGTPAPGPVVRRVLDQVEGLLEGVDDPPGGSGPALHSPAARADDAAFRARWTRLVRDELAPAIRRYRDFLATTYLPAAREDAPGFGATPGGRACWLRAVESWTTLDLDADEIERRGRAYLAELRAELVDLAGAEDPSDVPAVLDRLREGGVEGGFETRADIAEHARRAIDRAIEALPAWFAEPGENRIEVVPMDPALESSFPAGFYRRPASADAPAAYVVNGGRPSERRLMSEVIAFHETVPGHHTSFAVPAAHGNAPMASFNSGYVEGWAIYAERLADEMGLYSTPLDRLGLVAKHLWAASRLVVEPGLHLHGWSRDRAIAYLVDHSTLSEAEAALEVDRYLALPGQSLAYVLGYLELREARRTAEAALGERFDVRDFHDVVLRDGVRPLAEVQEDVEAWIARVGADPAR